LRLKFYIAASIITTGTASSGTSSAETSEASSASAVTPATASAASHEVSEEEEEEAEVAGTGEEDDDQQDDAAADEYLHRGEGDLLGLLAAVVVLGSRERDSCVGGDDLGQLLDADGDALVVVTGGERGHHGSADITDLGIVEDAFEAVSDLDPAFSRVENYEDQDASICALCADLPLLLESGGEVVDRLVVVEGFDGDYRYLRVGLAIDLGAEVFEVQLRGRGEDAGEVADVAGRPGEICDLFGVEVACGYQKQDDNQQTLKSTLHQCRFYALAESAVFLGGTPPIARR
jgi:hypothetical protein